MAIRKNSGGFAAMVGRELGKLAARKDSLARQLAAVEKELASVGNSVAKAMGRAAPKAKATAKKAVRKAMSPATRRKMAAAAKRRWAEAKKAGKKTLG
jgi:hypothetical protein